MSVRRLERVNELLKREIAGVIYKIGGEEKLDLAAVTVTHVITSPDIRHARVMVSVRDHEQERRHIIDLLTRHRGTIQRHINSDLKLKYTPQLTFELDESIEKGDRILSIISELGLSDDDTEKPDGDE
ncbi:MAG TPA: 30S ribosome-binding factor RbfA [Kiritimatiellia bacterium]|nr:30S ribosome-binding factor RbfA [Kiritimatiellia bacterium]HNR93155.1 30S ribosome-binding factor RbfA [Kiritimatiellia bacterium]HNS80974.1 30S ribosome-binding factor RbfA [Kiritimatiellia bacterium]HPA77860.1 30S ribosome-binding factor RbfA [Kiritimatiellia bacterium]HQQ04268.1 30S ribosome-binding factor RbfA [Kiritimatiellia bacterium]